MRDKVNLILDSDIGCDCDDAGAMAVMHRLADAGECHILAVTHCTSRSSGVQCTDAINRYFGRPEIPVGTYGESGFLDGEPYEKFSRVIAARFDHQFKNGAAPESAVRVMRRALTGAEDKSVRIAAIGPLNNISLLLNSPADDISKSTGRELILQKVDCLFVMGGHFPETSFDVFWGEQKMEAEWNILEDIASAKNITQSWLSPLVFVPYEIGAKIITGRFLLQKTTIDNPVHMAYSLYCGGPRESWDQATVLYAIRESFIANYFVKSSFGSIEIDEQGVSHFNPDPSGKDCYLQSCHAEYLTDMIEHLMV